MSSGHVRSKWKYLRQVNSLHPQPVKLLQLGDSPQRSLKCLRCVLHRAVQPLPPTATTASTLTLLRPLSSSQQDAIYEDETLNTNQ